MRSGLVASGGQVVDDGSTGDSLSSRGSGTGPGGAGGASGQGATVQPGPGDSSSPGTAISGGQGGGVAMGSGVSPGLGGSGGHVIATGGSIGRGGSGGSADHGGSGGRPGTGGATAGLPDASVRRTDALEVAPPVGTPTINPDTGFTTIATGKVTMSGYVIGSGQGSGTSFGLTYDTSSFCGRGTVGASPTYSSWVEAGFTVNQTSQQSGSVSPLVLDGSSIAVTYVNRAGSTLELQLWDNASSRYWCHYLAPANNATTVTIKFSELNSKCWDNTGTPFTSGTAITSLQLVVPCDARNPTPYDFCFLGLIVN